MLWSCLEIVVVEGRSPTVGDPLATNPLAWEENRHGSHYCSPWVITSVEELLWNLFLFVTEMYCFSQSCLQTNKLPGLLDSLLESTCLSELALFFCGNVILGQLVMQIKLQLMWNTTNRGTDSRILTLVLKLWFLFPFP